MSLLLITGSTLLGAVLLLIIMKPKKLHVEVEPMKMKVMGINIWPLLVTMNNLMPEGMRKNAVTKQVTIIILTFMSCCGVHTLTYFIIIILNEIKKSKLRKDYHTCTNIMLQFTFLQNAPKPGKIVKDLYDLNGTSPYKTEEVVPGKIWEIIYIHENTGRTDADAKKQMKDIFGLDPK